MSDAPHPAADPAPPTAAGQSELALLRDITLDLADAARQFALLLLDRANQTVTEAGTLRLAAAFERTSRAARRAILLNRHLAKPERSVPPPARAKTQPDPAPAAETPAESIAKAVAKAIASAVSNAVNRAFAGRDPAGAETDDSKTEGAETAVAESRDRLDKLDFDPDHIEGPLQPIIDGIKRDLRRAFDECSKPLKRRNPEDLACLQRCDPGSPPDFDTG